jgi:hypothetical protein
MSKTKPTGVRFDDKLLTNLKEAGLAKSPQHALNLYEKSYKDWFHFQSTLKQVVAEKKNENKEFNTYAYKEGGLYRLENGKFVETIIPDKVNLPADYQNWTKVGILNKNGEVVPLDFLNPLTTKPDNSILDTFHDDVKKKYENDPGIVLVDKKELEAQIKELQAKKCPSYMSPQKFKISNEKAIEELKKQLNG